MKYLEFKAEVEKMGFVVDDSSTPIYVDKNEDGETLMSIGRHKRFWLDPGWSGFEALDEGQKLGLYALGYQLAKTPLAEREEEKRYWLQKIPVPLLGEKHGRYFCKALVPNYQNCVDIDRSQNSQFQTIFTESEIAAMDITGFQKVEVTPE